MGARPLPRTAIGLPRPAGSLARSFAEPPLRAVEWLLGLSGIEAAAQRVERGLATNGALGEVMLESTGVRAVVDARELAQIPARGGAVLCSNHPFGGADAITLIALALRRRSDVKVLANGILRRLPFMADHCIFVDPFGGTDAARANAAALRDALAWLRDGHLLIVFPAGEVSAIAWGRWTPADPPWSVIPFRLAQKTNARIVPAWCDGCNRTIFHAAGLLHPRLRTALLLGEFVARFGREVHFRIGAPFDANDGGLAPEEKLALVRREHWARPVVMVGDGVNDLAALAAADVGVAVRDGVQASHHVADVCLAASGMRPLERFLSGARSTMRAIRVNLAVSLGYNLAGGALAFAGFVNPLVAAVLMPLSGLTVLVLALRIPTFDLPAGRARPSTAAAGGDR